MGRADRGLGSPRPTTHTQITRPRVLRGHRRVAGCRSRSRRTGMGRGAVASALVAVVGVVRGTGGRARMGPYPLIVPVIMDREEPQAIEAARVAAM